MCLCTSGNLSVHSQIVHLLCGRFEIYHTDMKNGKTDMIDKNGFVDKADWDILKHLNHSKIDLCSDIAQRMIFCF